MKLQLPEYLRLTDLAEASRVHVNTIERYLYRDVLEPDARVQHGRVFQPIFLKSKLKEHLANIRRYRDSLDKETVEGKN
jgi:hypothetical protein